MSPNALLRPVFQDTILPTVAYVAGPAEMAYFAQAQVAYARLLGRVTPVLPRLSATLVEHAIAHILDRCGFSLQDVLTTPAELSQRMARGQCRLRASRNWRRRGTCSTAN